MGRRDDAGIELHGFLATDAQEGPLLQRIEQTPLDGGIHVGDLAEIECPAVGLFDEAVLDRLAEFAAEELVAGELARDGRRAGRDERPGPTAAAIMQIPREELLAAAGLSRDQDPGAVLGDALHLFAQGDHDRRLAQGLGRRGEETTAVEPVTLESLDLKRALDDEQELGQRQRLLEEVVGPETGRLDGRLDRPMTRDHDHGTGHALGLRPLPEQGQAIGIGHPDIEQDQIGPAQPPGPSRLLGIIGHGDLVALVLEDLPDEITDLRLVVDDEYVGTLHVVPSFWLIVPLSALACKGRRMTKQAPEGSLFSTQIRPPCSSTIFLTMGSPRPLPLSLPVT